MKNALFEREGKGCAHVVLKIMRLTYNSVGIKDMMYMLVL